MPRKRRNNFIEMLGCKYLSRSRYLSIHIFPMPKSVRSEMISYLETFPRNRSDSEFVISIICALITSFCLFAFCRIHPPPFLSGYLGKKRSGFRSSLITTFKVSLSFRQRLTWCLDCTRRRTDRVAGGWKTGECRVDPETGNLEAIDTHISHLVPNVHVIPVKSSLEL